MIKKIIADAIKDKASLGSFPDGRPELPESLGQGIPTLKKGVYREFSPMLKERFEAYGRWEHATHGIWLTTRDMESLWEDNIRDEILGGIKCQIYGLENGWSNHACSLFREERLSIFAGSHYSNECIFLLWLDFEDEPEFWVYDSNGESRYKNLKHYLLAYLADDISASEQSWRVEWMG
jgi:hypothetical protein